MYATIEDFKQRIGQSIFDEIYYSTGDSESTESPAVLSDLESAAAEIDGVLAYRYQFPVSGTKTLALLKDWNLTLAEERAFSRPVGGEFTEKLKSRVAQVRSYLEMIRLDQFRLPDAAEKNSAANGSAVAIVQCDEPVFGRDKMSGF